MSKIIKIVPITNAGITYSIDLSISGIDGYLLVGSPAPGVSLLADVTVLFAGTPYEGQEIVVAWESFVADGQKFKINGISLTDLQALSKGAINWLYINGAWIIQYIPNFIGAQSISGVLLKDATVTLAKLVALTSGRIIVGSAANLPTAVVVSGDVTINDLGVTAIVAGVVIDADINPNAEIERTKFAAGAANFIVTNDGSGVMSEAAFVTKAQGGFGENMAAKSGFTKWSSGTLDISAITVNRDLDISFEASGGVVPSVGDFKIKMDFDGTLTGIFAFATKAIAATSNGVITAKNNAGTSMTNGVITFVAGDARGTSYSVIPSTNNTFVAGDILTFTSVKADAGGYAHLSLRFTRLS